MEFKGTKGKWYRNTESRIVSSVYSENKESLIHIAGRNNEETKANAQLIAHAPEMLDMLDTVLNDYYNIIPQSEARDNRMRQINDLLTRATTI